MTQVLVIEGSRTDDEKTNMFLKILRDCNVKYRVDCASAHWYAGAEYLEYVKNAAKEKIVIFIGGMSLVAPGIISAMLRNLGRHNVSVFAVPTDEAARSAIEDLPVGTPVITSGLNTVSARHSIKNSALAVAKMVFAITEDPEIGRGLEKWFRDTRNTKPLDWNMSLDKNGLIPKKEEETN